jgi:ribosome-dependent ATPase
MLDKHRCTKLEAQREELRGSTYFVEQAPLIDYADFDKRLQNRSVEAAIEIPPGFGRDIKRGRPVWLSATVDGAMPFRAQTIRGYLQGMHQLYLADPIVKTTTPARPGLSRPRPW